MTGPCTSLGEAKESGINRMENRGKVFLFKAPLNAFDGITAQPAGRLHLCYKPNYTPTFLKCAAAGAEPLTA
jgi:hypothetical protein